MVKTTRINSKLSHFTKRAPRRFAAIIIDQRKQAKKEEHIRIETLQKKVYCERQGKETRRLNRCRLTVSRKIGGRNISPK
jgi:hypothetical protein